MYAKNQISQLPKAFHRIILLIIFLFAFSSGNLSSADAQAWTSSHQITYFQGNKPGAVSFTFDDGLLTQATAGVAELNARGLRGTFFVITSRGEVPWSTWQNLAAQGHEIASHTVTHRSLISLSVPEITWELSESQSIINQNVPNQSCITISYPLIQTNSTIQSIAAGYYVAARAGWDAGSPNFYEPGGDEYDTWNTIDFTNIGSTLGDNLDLNNWSFNRALNHAVEYHAWYDLHFHEITDAAVFGDLIDYVQEHGDYWIDTFGNISRYMRERLNSTIQVVAETDSEIRLQVIMDASLPVSFYNVPLTIRSTVPSSWAQVIVEQGNSTQIIDSVIEGNESVIYYNALPNGGDIVLAFPNPVPGLTSLNPASVLPGNPAFTLTVTGNNFINGSVVLWNNSDRATTYISATQLKVSIPASDIASNGPVNVSVFNPSPGGGLSNPSLFAVGTKPITVTVNPGQSKTYGGADPIFTYTSSDPAATFTGSLGRTPGESAGTYAINQGTLTVVGEYFVITSFIPADFKINKKTASVTPNSASKIYGGVDPSFTGSLGGFLPADNVTVTYSRVTGETVAGSPYTISAALSPPNVLGNYNITYNTANFIISKKTASVTPNAASKTYGSVDPSFTGTLSGFLPTDNVTAAYGRAAGETVGGSPYTISATLSPANVLGSYNITYNTANFTITRASSTVVLSSLNYIYDGTQKPVVATTDPPGLPVDITYDGSSNAPTRAGSYAVVARVNHPSYTGSASGMLVIAKAVVTPGVTANNKVYDGTNGATIATRSLTGVIGADVVSLSGGSASFVDKNVGNGKPVAVTGLALSGTDAGNYQLSSASAVTTANISPRTLLVTATGLNKVYDGTTATTVTLSDDRIANDRLITGYSAASFPDPNVGSGKTVNVSGISITSGADANNYMLGNSIAITTADITSAVTIPASATLAAPVGNIERNYDPNYTWNKVDSATYYRLYVSGPNGVVVDQWFETAKICDIAICSVTPGPSYTLGGGTYAWYVQTYNPVGYGLWSNNSQPTNFNATIPTVPAAAVLTEPKGDIGTNYTPIYKWGKVDTATYYRLYVSGPGGVVLDQWYKSADICGLATAGICSVTSPTLTGGNYVWYVQTYNSAGYGPWSNDTQPTNFNTSVISPEAAVLTAPMADIGTTYTPKYNWGHVDTVTWYRLYVSGPGGVVLDQWYQATAICGISEAGVCEVQSPLLGGGNYAWYVQTYNPAGYGKWSNTDANGVVQPTNFNTSTTLPIATALIEPKNDIGTNFYPTYKWGKVDTATYYRLYVSGPGGVVLDQWYKASDICPDASCSVPSPRLGVGAHVWYVQTYSPAGYGPWSNNTQPTNFNTSSPPLPGAANLIGPKNDIGTNYNPNFSWAKVDGTLRYRLYVSGSGNVLLDKWYEALSICNATTCTVASPTLAGGTYAWYVQAWNPAGYGPWSNNTQPTNFNTTTTPPIAAVLTEPKGNILEDYTPTYKWGKVATATYYRLYVSGPGGVVLDQWYQAVNICNGTTCSVASPTLGGGAYVWYVQTYSPAGYGPWSNNTQPTNFNTTTQTMPSGAVLTAPAGTVISTNLIYAWNRVNMAVWYRLYVKGPSGVVKDQWYQAVNICNTTSCSVVSPTLEGGDHTWWVQTYNSAGYGPWKKGSFTVSP